MLSLQGLQKELVIDGCVLARHHHVGAERWAPKHQRQMAWLWPVRNLRSDGQQQHIPWKFRWPVHHTFRVVRVAYRGTKHQINQKQDGQELIRKDAKTARGFDNWCAESNQYKPDLQQNVTDPRVVSTLAVICHKIMGCTTPYMCQVEPLGFWTER